MSVKVKIIDNDNGEVLLDFPEANSVILAAVDTEGNCKSCGYLRGVLPEYVGAAYAAVRLVEAKKAADPVFAALYESCAKFCELEGSNIREVQSE